VIFNIAAMAHSINMFESEMFVFIYINGFLLLLNTYFVLNREKVNTLLFILALSSTVVALDGIYQTGFWFKHIAETNESLNWDILETAKTTFRALGTFIHPNVMAGFLLMVIPLVYMFLIKKNSKPLLFLMSVIVTLGLFITYSRAAIALYIVSLPFLFIVLKKEESAPKVITYIGIVIVSALILLVFLVSSYNRLNKQTLASKYALPKIIATNDMSFIVRKDLAIGAIDIIKHHPWLGTGPGTFNIAYRMYQQGAIYSKYAHNNYLEMASEIGIPGLIVYLIFIGSMLWILGSTWKHGNNLAGVILISLVLFILHTFVDFDYVSPAVVWCLFLFAGVSLILSEKNYAY
ncbi:MAG: O-antigen ligase family protein, partial [bacterium]